MKYGVKNIQAAAYNGVCTVLTSKEKDLQRILTALPHEKAESYNGLITVHN